MTVRIKLIGLADGRPTALAGTWLLECDVDARDGRGTISGTVDRDEAMQFKTTAEALAYWKRQSIAVPFRDDGKPNRPLTSYTVEVSND